MGQEKLFEKQIKAFLDEQNCWYVKFFANAYTRQGIPDLLCCVNGYFLAVEVKSDNGRASDLQKWNVSRIRYTGGLAFILKPEQFDSFCKLVKELKELPRQDVKHRIDIEDFRKLYGVEQ